MHCLYILLDDVQLNGYLAFLRACLDSLEQLTYAVKWVGSISASQGGRNKSNMPNSLEFLEFL